MLPDALATNLGALLRARVNGQPLAALVVVELCIAALALLAYVAGRHNDG